jgi:hypothetical protein
MLQPIAMAARSCCSTVGGEQNLLLTLGGISCVFRIAHGLPWRTGAH